MSASKKFQGQSPDFTESLLGRVPLRDRGWRKKRLDLVCQIEKRLDIA